MNSNLWPSFTAMRWSTTELRFRQTITATSLGAILEQVPVVRQHKLRGNTKSSLVALVHAKSSTYLLASYKYIASSPDLPASFGTRSEAEGVVTQVT